MLNGSSSTTRMSGYESLSIESCLIGIIGGKISIFPSVKSLSMGMITSVSVISTLVVVSY